MALQHLRSSTANKRPTPGSMSDGQLAINTEATSPGVFFKNSAGNLVKVGPVHIGTSAPNVSPAGQAGNSTGEIWLDTTGGNYTIKIWDGSAWRSEATSYLPLAGGALTGDLTLNGQSDLRLADLDSSNWVALQAPASITTNFTLTLPSADGTSGQALTTSGTGTLSWSTFAPLASPTFTGTVTIPAGASISGYAPLASPTFTGTPAAPTAAVDTNTTQVATTAYVLGQASATTPVVDGTAAVGTSTRYARADHVHPTDTTRAPLASPTFTGTVTIPAGASISGYLTTSTASSTYAPLASPALTGTPTAPTASAGTNTTQIATTAFVLANAAPTASPTFTGAIYANGSYRGNVTAMAALDIDCSAGNYFTKTISSNATLTFSNVPASRAYAFTLELNHTSGTITWPASVIWPSGTAPTLTTGKRHLFLLATSDSGTTFRASSLINYAS